MVLPGRFVFRLFIATTLNSNEDSKRRGPSSVAKVRNYIQNEEYRCRQDHQNSELHSWQQELILVPGFS